MEGAKAFVDCVSDSKRNFGQGNSISFKDSTKTLRSSRYKHPIGAPHPNFANAPHMSIFIKA